ncbi:ABC transporter family substrate-binding protein [Brevibacterium sp. 50QC2O2]|uniref:ABC transporter family substrate-binding protein n=1 Tax=Brevibacterium TaxID=1696 RepID=UPI00211C281D|nr:ABC transporter family substrate-binding protein [Brevibacterium sp. 68QC2CO]MCQ9387497.1 ABC transporter family substrate-binding protein [Brevibacterium sp. 50QC2O2]
MKKRFLSAAALTATAALLLAGCTPNNGGSGASAEGGKDNAEVKVMWNEPLRSVNNNTTTGNATANSNIMYMMDDAFKYYDKDLKLQDNESFGKVEKVSDNPLKIKYTIADTAKWSDGTPYSAADLVLAWGALSTNFNTKDLTKVQDEEGNVKKQKGETVVFNAADPGVALIKKFPEIGADNKSVTFEYSKPFADWVNNLTTTDSGLPAHIVAKKALGIDDATKANEAVLKAFKDKDDKPLAKIANTWNNGFDFTKMPSDPDLLVGTGPFKIADFQENQYLTLERRDDYEGARKPNVQKITIRYNEDPTAAVQALQNGEVDIIQPQATADILKSVQGLDGVQTDTGDDATYEHVDLVFDNDGPFDPKTYGGDKDKALKVRQAFLKAIPREKIVTDIIKPLKDDAAVRNSFTQVPGSPDYDQIVKDSGIENAFGKQDIDGAKKLLAEAGASKPKVRIMYGKGNVRREQEFQLIKESAEQAGFQIVDGADAQWGQHLQQIDKYDASLFGWQSTSTAVTESDANFRTGAQNNYGKYSNKAVDKLYDQLQTELDPAKQAQIEGQVEKHLVDDGFGITLYQFPSITSYKNTLQGVSNITVAPTMFWNFYDWKMQ